jgi:hypothetical protein
MARKLSLKITNLAILEPEYEQYKKMVDQTSVQYVRIFLPGNEKTPILFSQM